jgi:sigma-B regulation protein RsbU (phosphoserine phosphatase)
MSPGLPFTETRDVLNLGDTLVLYSDGLTDAQNADGEEFGEVRLHDLLRSLAGQQASTIINRVLAAVEVFVDSTPQFDDMTILVLRRL